MGVVTEINKESDFWKSEREHKWHVSDLRWFYYWHFNREYALEFLPIGGNQRELARQKNAKKQAEQSKKKAGADKGGNKGMSLEERKHRCELLYMYLNVKLYMIVCVSRILMHCGSTNLMLHLV